MICDACGREHDGERDEHGEALCDRCEAMRSLIAIPSFAEVTRLPSPPRVPSEVDIALAIGRELRDVAEGATIPAVCS